MTTTNAQLLAAQLAAVGYPQTAPQVETINRDVGTYLDDSLSVNAIVDRWKVLSHPLLRREYEKAAKQAGLNFGSSDRLRPLIFSKTTPTSTGTTAHPGIPVALNANIPSVPLRFYFQDPTFLRRMTATVIGLVPTSEGMSAAGVNTSINLADYIYVMMTREGNGDKFMTDYIPLSEISGDGGASYFWNLIPMVRNGGSLIIELTIIPPGQQIASPLFVDRVALVTVSIHGEQFNPFGT